MGVSLDKLTDYTAHPHMWGYTYSKGVCAVPERVLVRRRGAYLRWREQAELTGNDLTRLHRWIGAR